MEIANILHHLSYYKTRHFKNKLPDVSLTFWPKANSLTFPGFSLAILIFSVFQTWWKSCKYRTICDVIMAPAVGVDTVDFTLSHHGPDDPVNNIIHMSYTYYIGDFTELYHLDKHRHKSAYFFKAFRRNAFMF